MWTCYLVANRGFLEHENWGTARNSMDILEKVLEDSETEDQNEEAMKQG